jgi:hypothetical protein
MPSRVPHRLFLQRLLLQVRHNLVTYLRFLLVCFIWLGLVPFLARWIWRFYFRFGDWSSNDAVKVDDPTKFHQNVTAGIFEDGFFGWLRGHDIWTAILRDCFQGQIITICLVAVFIVVFLIREWVMQHALPVVVEPIERAPPLPIERGAALHAAGEPINLLRWEARVQRGPPRAPRLQPLYEDRPVEERQLPNWGAFETADEPEDENLIDVPEQDLAEDAFEDEHEPDVIAEVVDAGAIDGVNVPRFNVDFDDDGLDGDDFDGLWDILGMQGPIIGLLHNTVFSALMIALAVGLGVWLPFMFGKTALGALVPFDFTVLILGTSIGYISPTSLHGGSIKCRCMS